MSLLSKEWITKGRVLSTCAAVTLFTVLSLFHDECKAGQVDN
jgi:hypothetical protein